MQKNTLFGILLAVAVIGGGLFLVQQSQPSGQTPQSAKSPQQNTAQGKKAAVQNGVESATYNANDVLAGEAAPYLTFSKTAYDQALKENKVIVLNFYADWCPICRAEKPDVLAAFNSLTNENVVGFQVNFKDNETDAEEKALAQEFQVPYQHTKVILKNGKQVLKETAQWDKKQFVDAITTISE